MLDQRFAQGGFHTDQSLQGILSHSAYDRISLLLVIFGNIDFDSFSYTDFVVAGRRLGPLLMAGTLAATEIGGGSSLGVVQNGMSGYGMSAAWYIIAMGIAFVILSFLAPKFRGATVKTVPEYFRRRYGKGSGLITAIIMFLPLIGLTAGQFIASSVILSTMLGIDYQVAVIIAVQPSDDIQQGRFSGTGRS